MRAEADERDGTAPAPGAPTLRWGAAGLAVGAVLAVAATVVVFLTDDPQVLRLAVVGGAWAFVLALLAAGRRRAGSDGSDGVADLRRATEREREAAGRREHEIAAENRLRRESDDAMRAELAALRRDVAGLAALRSDVAALGALRQDVAALAALRQDVAALGALRQDVAALGGVRQDLAALGALRAEVAALGGLRHEVAALGALRQDVAALGGLREDVAGPGGLREEVARLADARTELGQLADLRAELGRLRTELTEQLSSEMFLERVVMRTQSSRGPVAAATVEGPSTRSIEAVSWSDEPPRELTGGWPAIRLESAAPPPAPAAEVPVTRGYEALQGIRAQQQATRQPVAPATDPFRAAAPAEPPRRRRRTDDAGTAEQLTVERPLASIDPVSELDAWPRPPAPLPADLAPAEPRPAEPLPVQPLTVQAPGVPTPGEARLAQILAESEAAAPRSGRRRHRYRDDDEADDVLSRVLGRP